MAIGNLSITDASGASPSITTDNSRETVFLRSATGDSDVYVNLNAAATGGTGFFFSPGDIVILKGRDAKADIYFDCDTSGTATVSYLTTH